MNFLKHATNWCKGEFFEGSMILLFGVIFLIITFCFWKFGTTPNARLFIVPTLILSLFFIGTGIYSTVRNHLRIPAFEKAYQANPDDFVKKEKVRTEEFIQWYPGIRYGAGAVMIVFLLIFVFTNSHLWKSISLCTIVLAFSLLVIDFFSEERGVMYHNHINEYLSTKQ